MKKFIVSHHAKQKLSCFVDLVETEISGMGKTNIDELGNVILVDVMLFEQTCSCASTNIESKSLAKFLYNLQKNNENTKEWNCWWHSHASMSTFWSPTDNKTIEDHAGGGSHLISLVTNKKNEYKARLDIFPKDNSPFKISSFIKQDLDVTEEVSPFNKQFQDIIQEAILEKQRAIKECDKIIQDAKSQMKEETTPKNIITKCQKEIDTNVTVPKPLKFKYGKQIGFMAGEEYLKMGEEELDEYFSGEYDWEKDYKHKKNWKRHYKY